MEITARHAFAADAEFAGDSKQNRFERRSENEHLRIGER